MKKYFPFFLCLSFAFSCGSKESQDSGPGIKIRTEAQLGLKASSSCARARAIRGSNSLYEWVKAAPGNLQKIFIESSTYTITYNEANDSGFIQGVNRYEYKESEAAFYFNTTSKSLKFKFTPENFGEIENDHTGQIYIIGTLTYNDGSGYYATFLCEKN